MANTGVKPIVTAVAGAVFLYSGFKGIKLSTTIRDLLTGTNPADSVPNAQGGIGTAQYGPPTSYAISAPNAQGGVGNAPYGPPIPTGKQLTPKQIYAYARNAGFSKTGAVYITAIAMAESGGRVGARCHNCVPGVAEDSRGLTQVNVNAHPWALQGNIYDPQTNLNAAYAISNHGKDFTPWTTYTNGAYQAFMHAALKAAGVH